MRARLAAAVLAAATLGLAACGGGDGPPPDTVAHATPTPQVKVEKEGATNVTVHAGGRRHHRAARQAGGEEFLDAAARADFDRLENQLGSSIGLTISAVGKDKPVTQVGSLTSGVAWSTSKAPVALAVVRQAGGHPSADERELMRKAITASDNAAAQALWEDLGAGETAAAKVDRVLAEAGDTTTRVNPFVTRQGFTAFGQTVWPLASQQKFIADLECLPDTDELLGLMGTVEADQRWGLGSAGLPAIFKGGWGPDPDGRYLVRQMGLLELPGGGRVAVTVATRPGDGTFETGQSDLTTMAKWLAQKLDGVTAPPVQC